MDLMITVFVGMVGYLFGSISFSRIMINYLKIEQEQRELVVNSEKYPLLTGYGANYASMQVGAKFGLLVAFLDIAKAIIPILLLKWVLLPG